MTERLDPRSGTTQLIGAWCLLVVGDSLNRGDWEISALVCLLLGFGLTLFVAWQRFLVTVPTRNQLLIAVGVCAIAAIAHPVSASMQLRGGRLLALQVVAAAAAVSVAIGLVLEPRGRVALAVVSLGLVIATAAMTIGLVRHPDIDVWAILQQSSTGLVHGDDMYRQHWIDGYGLKNVYPYLPWSTILIAPFRLLGDVRIGLVLLLLLGSWQLRRMAPAAPFALAALVLVSPHWAYYVVRSWTEPELMVLLFALLLSLRGGRNGWAMIWLGVALACKQPIVLLVPVLLIWPGFGWRRVIGSGVIAIALISPWLIAGPRDFWHDAVSAELGLGTLNRALSVPSGLAHANIHLGFGLLALTLIGIYALIWFRMPRTPAGLAMAFAIVIFGYDLANTQSFFNHYQLAADLLIAALALAGVTPPSTATPFAESRMLDTSRVPLGDG